MELTQEHRLTVVEDRSLRNEGRIKKLEGEHEVLQDRFGVLPCPMMEH